MHVKRALAALFGILVAGQAPPPTTASPNSAKCGQRLALLPMDIRRSCAVDPYWRHQSSDSDAEDHSRTRDDDLSSEFDQVEGGVDWVPDWLHRKVGAPLLRGRVS
jgi:hypothetical protein